MKDTRINWNKYFDHIFIISRCKNFDKRESLESHIKDRNLNLPFKYWYNCDSERIWPIKNIKQIESSARTTYGHYSLWKTCYELGYDNVLIFEDDVRFVNNKKLINQIFKNFKKTNSDIYMFDWINHTSIRTQGYTLASGYYLNRRGLEFLVKMHEKYNINNDAYFMGLHTNDKNISYSLTLYLTPDEYIHISYMDIPNFNVSSTHLCIQPDYLNLYCEKVENFNKNLYED